MSYDPELRIHTPLAAKLEQRIRREGPITVAAYMQACLHDPEHGYYVGQPAIGGAGDFITAPEISQVFGELIGLWCVVAWQQMGAPPAVRLVELGPGRGTLMRDGLRAAKLVPAFLAAVRVDLVETNMVLTAAQRTLLHGAGVPLAWRNELDPASLDGPCLVVANEFLDAFPVSQSVLRQGTWRSRVVTLDRAGALAFAVNEHSGIAGEGGFPRARCGDIAEARSELPLLQGLHEMSRRSPLAALFVDYGHLQSSLGDTLQGVRNHRFEHPLTAPGEADLTTQVDFQQFGENARACGFAVDGPVTQAEFLGALGIVPRASRLMAANPRIAHEIEAGVARLLSPTGMGTRFKAIGIRSRLLPPLPGFPVTAG